MDTAKIYKSSDGNSRTINQMVKYEPHWAANRIQVGEKALEVIAQIKEWDIEKFMQNGAFSLPQNLREQMQKVGK